MPGVTIAMCGPTTARTRAASRPDATTPSAAGVARERGAARNEVGGRGVDALLAEVGGVQVGEHGDAEDLEAGAGAAGQRGAQGLGVVRVHGEERGAGRRRIAGGPLHRVLDVEQLHVEEDLFAGSRQLAREIEAAAP